jgi:ribosomal protein S27AE
MRRGEEPGVSAEDKTPDPATPALPIVPGGDAAQPRFEKCPHCGSLTLIEPSSALRFRCGVCGKARVPTDLAGFVPSDAATPALARASAAYQASLAWRTGSVFLAAFSLFSLAVMALVQSVADPPAAAALIGFLLAVIPMGIAGYSFRRAALNRSRVEPALDEAWTEVGGEVAAALGSATPAEFGKPLRLAAPEAEALLAQLSAQGKVSSSVDEGKLEFRAARPTGLRAPKETEEERAARTADARLAASAAVAGVAEGETKDDLAALDAEAEAAAALEAQEKKAKVSP